VDRLHAAIGKSGRTAGPGDGRGADKTGTPAFHSLSKTYCDVGMIGIIMSLHLFQGPQASAHNQIQLCLLLAYENGSVSLAVNNQATEKSIEGRGWNRLWTVKSHVESGK
jgi:ASTRA-associated protein 1